MARLPRLTGKEIITALQRIGFEVARVKGSHHFLRHSDTVLAIDQARAPRNLRIANRSVGG